MKPTELSRNALDQSADLKLANVGLRKLLKQGRVSAASVLACAELVSLDTPRRAPASGDGPAAARVAQALRLAIENMKDRDALEVLFGLAPSSENMPLQARRSDAAALLGIKAESFRVRRESQLLERVARALVAELAERQPGPGLASGSSLRDSGQLRLFIGSSSEAVELVEGLRLSLDGKALITDWSSAVWSPSRTFVKGMEEALDEADFAAFILSSDDAVTAQDQHLRARENILLELGLSIGRLGRDRTFVLAPKGSGSTVRSLSDLAGISVLYYERQSGNRTAMSELARRVWADMQARGPRDRGRTEFGLEPGDIGQLDMLADAAVSLDGSRDTYVDELRSAVQWGQRVPAKFQFAHADGGRYWLRLCRSVNYRYFQRAKRQVSDNAVRLADVVEQAAGTAAVDLVSLGCGDGSKDDIILRTLARRLASREYLYYYPVEISDILLVEALRYIGKRGVDRSRFRCKAILGDFTNLDSFSGIIGERPNTNLFSCLGNTIGSFDESEIFASLAGAMLPGDLVLIEANTGDPEESEAFLMDDVSAMWDLSTLEALGIEPESCELGTERRTDVSMVRDTRSLISYGLSSKEKDNRKYMLSALHHYDAKQLERTISSELDVTVLDVIDKNGVCLLLGQRRRWS